MSEQLELWKMRPGRVGIFGKYNVSGFQCDGAGGKRAWYVMFWGDHTGVTIAWVEDKKFRRVSLHLDGYGHNGIQDHGEMKDVPEDERKAVFEAIAKWEKSIASDTE